MADQVITDANHVALYNKAVNALTSNIEFLGIGNPSNAQLSAQVTALTRQTNGIIRVLIGQLSVTDGT